MSLCLVNGQQQAQISLTDRGLAYGDGLFTTAKVVNGQVEFLAEHLARLVDGCRYLAINYDHQALLAEINEITSSQNVAVLKIIITSGRGGRGYSRQGVEQSQRILTIHSLPAHYQTWSEQGITLENSQQQLGINPMLKGLKHLNRLEQVLIRTELDNADCDDLLVTDINGRIVETSCANVFWFANNQLFTPNIISSGVAGVYRKLLLANDSDIVQLDARQEQLNVVQAMFICNSVMGIVPVRAYQGQMLDIDIVKHYRADFLHKIAKGIQE